jgi:SAM-dependent methyltransferase
MSVASNPSQRFGACRICGSTEVTIDLQIVHDGSSDSHSIAHCGACGVAWTVPVPTQEELRLAYNDDYFTDGLGTHRSTVSLARSFVEFLSVLTGSRETIIPSDGRYRVLDIGSGSGTFLVAARAAGHDVLGIEPSTTGWHACQSQGLPTIHGSAEDVLPTLNEHFDWVVMNHCLEHLNDPKGALQQVWRLLRPGGRVSIGVPAYGSFGQRFFGPYWDSLDVPRHLYHWSPESLADLLSATRFKVESTLFQFNPYPYARSSYAMLTRTTVRPWDRQQFSVALAIASAVWAAPLALSSALSLSKFAPYFRAIARAVE